MKDPQVIRLDHFYSQPPAVVWKALTDPALHARWWPIRKPTQLITPQGEAN